MSAGREASPGEGGARAALWADIADISVCTLAWGTTWYAITLQFGVVDAVVSIVYRFTIAALVLFAWCVVRKESLALTSAQHGAALGNGVFTFGLNYAMVYWAEERVTSAVVAVCFASLAFLNLIAFRVAFSQRAPLLAWAAACLGLGGVALLTWEEVAGAEFGGRALLGVGLTLGAVVSAVCGNLFARRGELAGSSVAASTGWAMAYGAAALAIFAAVTGRAWNFDPSWRYALSLMHLALIGSVVAFLLYYGLARRRGYAQASYISALTPPLAMLVSAVFEGRTWGVLALGGVALVLGGQVLILRSQRR